MRHFSQIIFAHLVDNMRSVVEPKFGSRSELTANAKRQPYLRSNEESPR